MRFRDALRWSIRYHSLAIVPTLLGVGIVAAAFYVGAVRPALPLVQSTSLSPQLLTTIAGAMNVPLVLVGIVAGIYARRVGRTALLVRTQVQAIDAKLAGQEGEDSTDGEVDDSVGEVDDGIGEVDDSVGTYDDSFSNSGDDDADTAGKSG